MQRFVVTADLLDGRTVNLYYADTLQMATTKAEAYRGSNPRAEEVYTVRRLPDRDPVVSY